ncbi:MAG: hypothetical protein IJ038_05220 [Clostridia bacterium]|nr:hypothetical protein [Clostridia bacterium]
MNNSLRVEYYAPSRKIFKARGSNKVETYKNSLIAEMKKQGATESDLSLISDVLVLNSIKEERSPEEVVWALLQ